MTLDLLLVSYLTGVALALGCVAGSCGNKAKGLDFVLIGLFSWFSVGFMLGFDPDAHAEPENAPTGHCQPKFGHPGVSDPASQGGKVGGE